MADPIQDHKARAAAWFRALRDDIVSAFEGLEQTQGNAATFEVTPTSRADAEGGGGGGLMSVLRGGAVFEKVGVNWSQVHGTLGDKARAAMTARGVSGIDGTGTAWDGRFWASGISLVAHMQNPHCPAVHMNTRMFWTPGAAWFGGGSDLNPCIEYPEDTAHFHGQMQAACDAHDPLYYPRFKAWCDSYFCLKHRNEQRGIGGVFFDDFSELGFDGSFALLRSVGDAFLGAYLPIVERRRATPYGERERAFQLYRRGRYVEFNLVWDRGTHFGLQSGGRTESILLSMPPLASWAYQQQPQPGSPEEALLRHFLVPKDWV